MDNLNAIAIDPLVGYTTILNHIDTKSTLPPDPTNPYVLLLEAVSKAMTDSHEAHYLYERRHFESMSKTLGEIMHHIADEDTINLFATPAKGNFRFFVNLENLLTYGVKDSNKFTCKIPKYTNIEIDDTKFTILSDILISVLNKDDDLTAYIEQTVDDTTLINKNVGGIQSIISVDENNISWIVFDIEIAQLEVMEYKSEIINGVQYNVDIPFKDKYYTSMVYMEDTDAVGIWNKIEKIYVDSVIDVSKPSIYATIKTSSVTYKVPQIFIEDRLLAGKIKFNMFSTKGKILMDLNRYKQDEFTLTIIPDKSDTGSIISNISILVSSDDIILGGTNTPNFREIKKKLINRTTGVIDLPITEKQLFEKGKLLGYRLQQGANTILNRVYIASKELTSEIDGPHKPYIFSATGVLELIDENVTQSSIISNDKYTVVKPGTMFKYSGGILLPLSNNEVEYIRTVSVHDGASYLNKNDIYYTPFLYITDNDVMSTNNRVYQIDIPKLDHLEIKNKNTDADINVNINGYSVFQVGDNYELFFRLFGNDRYADNADKIELAVVIPLHYGDGYITIKATKDLTKTMEFYPDASEALYNITIMTSPYIDSDNMVTILNGVSTETDRKVNLESTISIRVYSNSHELFNTASLESKGYYKPSEKETNTTIGYTREQIVFTPIVRLDKLYSKVSSYYTERRYKKYTEDVPLLYKKDVYDTDPITGCDVRVYDDDNDGICDRWSIPILHHAGSQVFDSDGNPVMSHLKGDLLLDNNGNPIENNISGIRHLIDFVLLDYKLKYVNTKAHNDGLNGVVRLLNKVIVKDMVELNKQTLDNTSILYAPMRTIDSIVTTDGVKHTPTITPIVTLYIYEYNIGELPNTDVMIKSIGGIIQKYLSKSFITIEDIEKEIMETYDYISLVEVKGITTDNRRYVNIKDGINRFNIKYKIDNNYDIVYSIKLNVVDI